MRNYRFGILLVLVILLLCGCRQSVPANSSSTLTQDAPIQTGFSEESSSESQVSADNEDEQSALILLNGSTASCSSNAVRISGSTITIMDEGTYIISGTLEDGMIIIDSDATEPTQLILKDAAIHSETFAPIYILQAEQVHITMADGSTNTLSNGGSFSAIDENNVDAVIYSKEDIILNGSGTLTITSPAGHGIVSKDALHITSGNYNITCSSHALSGKDEVLINNGNITIVSGKDGIHAENPDDPESGCIILQNGTYTIESEGDGISASSSLLIHDGMYTITCGGGSANAASKTSESWGHFKGGGKPPVDSNATTDTTDSTSMKGIKATSELTIHNGTFSINSADDAIHSNENIMLYDGTFQIASGDDAYHADNTLTVNNGSISITECYEGLEGLHIHIAGGNIVLNASDDGLNAAGGVDSSGATGGRDGMFGGPGMHSSNGSITISGGNIHITAYGDGIDANGSLEITDGLIVVIGPTHGDTATLDYDSTATISGGTFIGTGASGMAQTFSNTEQGVIAVNAGNQATGTAIKLIDSEGSIILNYSSELDFSIVILSCPDIIIGESYMLYIGSVSGEFTAY